MGLALRHLYYVGPMKEPAGLSFKTGLNVVCGATDTGKSFVADSIDFMLGQEAPVRDIPERSGYDRVRLAVKSSGRDLLTFERSVAGGHLMCYSEELLGGAPTLAPEKLLWHHKRDRQDTLSYVVLECAGLAEKTLRKNAAGKTRAFTIRDLARLCTATEEEIIRRVSPFLSGQVVTATSEYAALKLLLTGIDDSALTVVSGEDDSRRVSKGKVELLESIIADMQAEVGETEQRTELETSLAGIEKAIDSKDESLQTAQKALDTLMQSRSEVASEIRISRARLDEIGELLIRFELLESHYQSDRHRLEAIRESGSLFLHLDAKKCPLCGAPPQSHHLQAGCDGNVETIVAAATGEMVKITRLQQELDETVRSLEAERCQIAKPLKALDEELAAFEEEIKSVVAPTVSCERASYEELITQRAEVRMALEKAIRLEGLKEQLEQIEAQIERRGNRENSTRTAVPKETLDEFAHTVERILEEWHYPGASRVFFDEGKRDILISGKERGSAGKGLRAITHAAMKIALLEFCKQRGLPHLGVVVLDSPLLSYWKPEGDEDDLTGTDVKEMFYKYLMSLSHDCQVIVFENQHPPDFVIKSANVEIFTKNPHQGRYGFFPHS